MVNYNDFSISDYPASDSTNPNILQQSLGSFWNSIFQEKTTITGYCEGLAEELVQTYYNLVDTVNSIGINDFPVLNKEDWYPLIFKLSDLNRGPLQFETTGAVFGTQPPTDPFYPGVIFQFGGVKTPTQNVWTLDVPATFAKFSIITNRVINPSVIYTNNVDVQLNETVLYFNSNPFNNPGNTVYPIINQSGVPATFIDSTGSTVNDGFIVLWAYNCELDNQNVTNNFGYLYNLTLPSTEQSKKIMQGLFSVSVGGATPARLKSLIAALADIPVVIEASETVQYVFDDSYSHVVVTDQNVYRYDLALNLLPTVTPGTSFEAGDVLVDAIAYYDSSVLPQWWETAYKGWQSVPFSSSAFLGNYNFQLSFSNNLELVTLSEDGVISFPVEGDAQDVATFNAVLNDPANSPSIIAAFGLSLSSNPSLNKQAVPIVPAQWLFQNFFRDNMALLYINLPSAAVTSQLLSYMSLIRPLLPPYVFLMQQVTLNYPEDIYDQLNDCYSIPTLSDTPFNADGSDANGFMSKEAPYYFNDLPTRLFVVARTPTKSGTPLLDPSQFDVVDCNNSGSGQLLVTHGTVFTNIPEGATTRTTRTLNILSFN